MSGNIDYFSAQLQSIVQQNYLSAEFYEPLNNLLIFRSLADRVRVSERRGDTRTYTRSGLMTPTTTPLNPDNDTNFDNGLSQSTWSIEQWKLFVQSWGTTKDLNLYGETFGLLEQLRIDAKNLGIQAATSLDLLARDALYSAYLGGNTWVNATNGAPGTSVSVDDIRGFDFVVINGVQLPVGTANPAGGYYTRPVLINGDLYQIMATTADVVNVSTSQGGISGTLTLSANALVADATTYNSVYAYYAPFIVRAGAKPNTMALTAADTFTLNDCMNARTYLKNNNVPGIDGSMGTDRIYNVYCNEYSIQQIVMTDPNFKNWWYTRNDSKEIKGGILNSVLGLNFVVTTQTPLINITNSAAANISVQRPIVCGGECLVEGTYDGLGDMQGVNPISKTNWRDGVLFVVRPPMDRLSRIVAQSWSWAGGYVCPTDVTTNSSIIPTASNKYFKRAVVIEHGGAANPQF